MAAGLTLEQIRAQVRRIQASAGFAAAPTLRHLLEFTVERAVNGGASEIKETTLAVEVFGRKTSFDPRSDSIVRVQARKLRDRIAAYYERDGAQDEIIIEYTRGSYVPRFGSRTDAPPTPRSIAVLPFADLSPTTAVDYFCQGLSEEIVYLLSRIHSLRIVARASSLSLRGSNHDVQKIGRELNADLLVKGTVRQSNDRTRIAAQLIDTEDGYLLWSGRWERAAADIFRIQDEIATAIAGAVRPRFSAALNNAASTQDVEAYRMFTLGRFHWHQRTEHGFGRAVEHYRAAVKRDPGFARAHAALAETFLLIAAHHLDRPLECLAQARDTAARALCLDPGLAPAHATMAAIRLIYDKKPAEADREWKVAMELDPNHAYTWHTFGFLGSFVNPHSDEILAAMQRAYRLEPLSAAIACDMAMPYHLRGQYDSAVTQCHAALDLHPAFTRTYVYLARSQAAMGMYDAAIETCLRARPMFTGRAYLGQLLAILGFAYGRAGETREAVRLVRELEDRSTRHFVAACDLGLIYAGIGDADRAMEFLERAYDQQEVWVIAFPNEPLFRVLDGHARFQALARRVFPECVR